MLLNIILLNCKTSDTTNYDLLDVVTLVENNKRIVRKWIILLKINK